MAVKEPKWSIGQRTDFELRDLRTTLETKLATLPETSPERAPIVATLTAVTSEQATRRVRRKGPMPGNWADVLT
jgi:hypothetical protein